MIELRGKYNTAKVFTDNVEQTAISQVIRLLNQRWLRDEKVRFMPDIHAGAGCTIGTTMTLSDAVVPEFVGVDIDCGVYVAKLTEKDFGEDDFAKLDKVIRSVVPLGFNVNQTQYKYDLLYNLRCFENVRIDYAFQSLGSLGGGNHFIELSRDSNGNVYLLVHTGSRHLGVEVAGVYTKQSATGPDADIPYIDGDLFDAYITDMEIAAAYAGLNRELIVYRIENAMGWRIEDSFTTEHNYIDIENMILRKGAVSAQDGEMLVIPMNMRDGTLLCRGKGNPDWNFSAPHGAGRLMSRGQAKRSITLEAFQKSMEGIYTTSVSEATLDEAPMAYKDIEEIKSNIQDTVDIIDVLKPIYNIKDDTKKKRK